MSGEQSGGRFADGASARRRDFPLNQLRVNGLIQSAIIALILATKFHHTPPHAPTVTWAWVAGAYAVLAATVPWTTGGFLEDEFRVRQSIVLGIVFALPAALAASWLRGTPYRSLGIGFAVLAGLWCVHLLVSVGSEMRGKRDGEMVRG